MKVCAFQAFAGRMPFFWWRCLCCTVLLMGLLWSSAHAAHSSETEGSCAPQMIGSWGARETTSGLRPLDGWEAVKLPHAAGALWPQWAGAIWYRVDWKLNCSQSSTARRPSLALAISGIRLAGTVYWNDELLWSDRSLIEPYSRSWNMPRWWPVSVQKHDDVQTAWVRVVAAQPTFKGVGYVQLGDMDSIQDEYATRYWRQRTSYVLTAGLSLTLACVALVVWLWRRSEPIYLWMGLMQLFWALYLSVILSTEHWPGLSSKNLSMLNLVFFMLYAQCFVMFILRFGGQRLRKFEYASWAALAVWIALMLPEQYVLPRMGDLSLVWGAVLFNGSCWYFIYRALHTRERQHLLLAACCLVFTVVGLHDIEVALRRWDNDQTWASFMWPLNMVMLAVLLGWQVAKQMRRIDNFNAQLQHSVTAAQAELAQVLERQHARDLQSAKLQERVQLAHDLHDGLGGSLVRSMALVEQAPQQLSNERVMSLLKSLRDDLRQVIDTGSAAGATLPDTPAQWLAPLRHRAMRIADELGMQVTWQVAAEWQQRPSALQGMGLIRFLEEAFTNVLKHSQARSLLVRCHQPAPDVLVLSVEDDGLGFDVQAVMDAGLSVGMRSMQSRMARIGGKLQVQSRPGCTLLTATVKLSVLQIATNSVANSA